MSDTLRVVDLVGHRAFVQKETEGRRLQLHAAVMAESMKVATYCLLTMQFGLDFATLHVDW